MAGIEHTLPWTEAVNAVAGEPVASVLDAMGAPYPAETPIPDHVVVSAMIIAGLWGGALYVRKRLKEIPEHWSQHLAELFMNLIHSLVDDIIGPKGRQYRAIIASLALFIAVGNLIGLFPLFESPTASPSTTFALAISIFVYYHWHGVKEQGVLHYLRHFAGPRLPLWGLPLNALFFVIEILSHFSRILSLAVRLFGNIFGEDVVLIILFSLLPYFVPIPVMGLAIFTSLIQAFIFVMLSMMYIAGAVAVEEH